jgi:hypothetical protein
MAKATNTALKPVTVCAYEMHETYAMRYRFLHYPTAFPKTPHRLSHSPR